MKKGKYEYLQKKFRHFAMRLYERYNIFITFEEYLEIHRNPFKLEEIVIGENGRFKTYLGWVKIKDRDVLVYKSPIGYKAIITALSLDVHIDREIYKALNNEKNNEKNNYTTISTNIG